MHDLGQSLWFDYITQDLLSSGTLDDYIHEFSVTGLTSNPAIFYNAVKGGHSYDDAIAAKDLHARAGRQIGAIVESAEGSRTPFSNMGNWTAAKNTMNAWAKRLQHSYRILIIDYASIMSIRS